MRAVIAGAEGQLGRALLASAPRSAAVVAFGRRELDITDEVIVRATLEREAPTLVLNAAAYTAVDKAEVEEGRAAEINGRGVGILAAAAREAKARFVHVSTDFVFDGSSGTPYATSALPSPLSAYGRTKLAGEAAAGPGSLVIRTAWVYARTGTNFVTTMLRLMGSRREVRVVADQVGTPTYAPALAKALWALAQTDATGILHYTDAGLASWYDFAVAIQEEALAAGILQQSVSVIPIATSEFPTAAKRPSYSVLDKQATWAMLGQPAPHWRVNLRLMMRELRTHG